MSIARLQQAGAVLFPLASALLVWLLAPQAPWWTLVLAALALPMLVTAVVLGIEFAVAAIVDPRSPRSSILRVLRIWHDEVWSSLKVFMWQQPWQANFAEPSIERDPQRPAVLLVHGFMCNRARWLQLLASGRLRGCNVATVNLEPIFGSIEHYADIVHGAVERLRSATGAARVVLVAHSMGGLACRVYLRKHGAAHIAHVVTLATPHQGTLFGRFGFANNAREMVCGSPFLCDLTAADSTRNALFTCIATADDNLIVPRSSTLLPGARNHVIDGVGHLALVDDPRAWELLAAAVQMNAQPPIDGARQMRVTAAAPADGQRAGSPPALLDYQGISGARRETPNTDSAGS